MTRAIAFMTVLFLFGALAHVSRAQDFVSYDNEDEWNGHYVLRVALNSNRMWSVTTTAGVFYEKDYDGDWYFKGEQVSDSLCALWLYRATCRHYSGRLRRWKQEVAY